MRNKSKVCPHCGQKKDIRSVMCVSCRPKLNPARLGTGAGFKQTSAGYIACYYDGKYRYQHREVMEKSLGRPLMSNEHVHHIDGNKSNNEISNLELMSSSEHHRLHIEARKFEMSKKGHKARWGYV